MPLAIGAVILGGVQAASSAYSARKAAEAASDQMSFQERMSGTSYQRAVEDLRAAGLNPILAARQGASTPSGAQPSQFFSADAAVGSAVQASRLRQEVRVMREQERNVRADTLLKDRQEMLTRYLGQKAREETHLTQTERLIQEEMLKGARVEGEIDEGKVGEWSRVLRRLLPGVNSAVGAARSVR